MSYIKVLMTEAGYDVGELYWNPERNVYEMMVTPSVDDQNTVMFDTLYPVTRPVKIGRGLIFSEDYQKSMILFKKLLKYDKPPFTVFKKDKETESTVFDDKKKLLSFLLEEGKRGFVVQRYKGLGEMNPEQLWNTTMDPVQRNLLQVKIEDAVEADEIFTILMGDEVEPRREFIQNNALEVTMLDI